MKQLSWDSFTKRIHIKAPVEKLFWCWTTEEGITSWFLKDAKYIREAKRIDTKEIIREGDQYAWMWHNWDGQEKGEILEVKKNKLVRFSFADNCEVKVTFEQKGIAVLVSLEQSQIPLDDKSKLEIFYGCSNGWTFWLANLKAFLEHGILLNETEIDLRPFDLAGFEFVNM